MIGSHIVSVQVSLVTDLPGAVIVSLQMRSIANQLYRQFNFKGAARSVTAMAAMLAHEVKNPLSGIKGAAQLLEQNAIEADLPLTKLICDETDRICSLVDRIEVFSDERPIKRGPVNIHEVLDHCRRIAESGFKATSSIMSVMILHCHQCCNWDILIQIFLNLMKNASEALGDSDWDGDTSLDGLSPWHAISVPGVAARESLQVTIRDNGPGIPDDMKATIFEPFVTSKRKGSGWTCLCGKGGRGSCRGGRGRPLPRRTEVRISLPTADTSEAWSRA